MLKTELYPYGFQRYHTRQGISFSKWGVSDVAKETHFLVLVKEPKKGSSQVHDRFELLLSVQATLQHTSQLKCGSKKRKRRPFSPILTFLNSCLHLFVLFFYIIIELILHFTDSVSHFSSSAQL